MAIRICICCYMRCAILIKLVLKKFLSDMSIYNSNVEGSEKNHSLR